MIIKKPSTARLKTLLERNLVTTLALASSLLAHAAFAEGKPAHPNPPEVWKDYDPDAGDFKEEIISPETKDGIYCKDSNISACLKGAAERGGGKR